MTHFLPDRVRKLRVEKSLSAAQLGEQIGVAGRAVYSWERGENLPNVEKIASLASYFKVSVSTFFNEPSTEDPYYTSDEIELINYYRELTEDGKELLMSIAQVFAGKCDIKLDKRSQTVNIGQTDSAGDDATIAPANGDTDSSATTTANNAYITNNYGSDEDAATALQHYSAT